MAERELGLRDDVRQRRPQLVGELRRQPLLAPEAGREAVEQPVEHERELGHLVVGRAEREAAVEIAIAPLCGLGRHPRDRSHCSRDQPPAGRGDRDQCEQAQHHRGDERRAPSLVVGRERDARDHGPEPASGIDHRKRVEARPRR